MLEYGLVILITLGGYLLVGWVWKKRNDAKLIAKDEERESVSKLTFIRHFSQKGYDTELVKKLYEEVQFYVPKKNFQMHLEDDLLEEYKIDDGDLEDLAVKLFEIKNLRKPRLFEIEQFNKTGSSINTFEGILKFASMQF